MVINLDGDEASDYINFVLKVRNPRGLVWRPPRSCGGGLTGAP